MLFLASGRKVISEIARDIGQAFFASVLIGPLVGGSANITLALFGLVSASVFWIISISLASSRV